MKRIGSWLVVLLLLASVGRAEKIKHTFSRNKSPQLGEVIFTDLDFTTSTTYLVTLPKNLTYLINGAYIKSKSVASLTAGATVLLKEVTTADADVQTLLPSHSMQDTDATGNMENLSPLTQNANRAGFVTLTSVAAATTNTAFGTVTDLSNTGTVTIASGSITSPASPRNVVITIYDVASNDVAGTITVTGTNWIGVAVSEAFTVVTGTTSYVGSQPFKEVTSVARALGTTGDSGDTLAMGYGVKLGLPYNVKTESRLAVSSVGVYTVPTVTPASTSITVTNFAGIDTPVPTYSTFDVTNFAGLDNITITTVMVTITNQGAGFTNIYSVITNVTASLAPTITNIYAAVTNGTIALSPSITNIYAAVTNVTSTAAAASVTSEAASAVDGTYGTFTATTAPNGSRSYDVNFNSDGPAAPVAISGTNRLKLVITGSTATTDLKDIVIQLIAL